MNVGIAASRLMAYAADEIPFEKSLLDGVDFEQLFKFSKAHSVANLVGYALKKLDMLPQEYAAPFLKELKLSMAREATQELETLEIASALEQRKIAYMLLKGSVMKNLYPLPYLRSMCDVDIQYDTAHRDELDGIMLELGYERAETSGTGDVNISYFKRPFMYVEFHGVLMDTDYPLYNSYFGNGFERTVAGEGVERKYTDEDFFVFMAAHLAKHYFLGGSGLRSLADIWLYLRKKPQLDMEYIFAELQKIKLDEFIKIMLDVNSVLFEGKSPSTRQESIISYVFGSGTYGTVQNSSADAIKNQSKASYLKERLFPSRDFMAINYPLVKKLAFLLPFFWIVRLISVFLKKGYKGSDVDLAMNVSSSQIDARKIPGNPAEYE